MYLLGSMAEAMGGLGGGGGGGVPTGDHSSKNFSLLSEFS